MSHFCIVAPSHILEQLLFHGEMGRAHLLLAHDVVAKEAEYRMCFKHIRPNVAPNFVVMDNSVIELKQAVDLPMIVEACRIVKPSCVVLPDVLEDAINTVASCSFALGEWSVTPGLVNIPLMYCPQGKTLAEFTRCAEQLAHDTRIRYWGCPRNLVKNIGSRQHAIKVLNLLNPHRPIHMLGFSDNLIDDMTCARMPEVYSIDSAVPLRCEGQFSLTTEMPPRGDWWEKGVVTQQTISNLNLVRTWCNA